MDSLRKAGGIAALIEAAAYLAGFALFIFVLDSSAYVGAERKLVFLAENRSALSLAMLLTYVLTAIALVVLAVALHERLKRGAPALMRIATPFGLIWAGLILASGMVSIVGIDAVVALSVQDPARAAAAWLAIAIVQDALGGGIELIGGLWVLLVSVAALASRVLPRLLNYLGIVVGLFGIVTVIPALGDMVDVFGLAMILWFGATGIVMLRNQERAIDTAPAPR